MNTSQTENRKNQFLVIVFTFLLTINLAFSYSPNEKIKYNSTFLKSQDTISHTEKIFLHFDKPYYSSGDQMWYKVYLVSADSNRPNAISKIVHVELINPANKIVISRKIKVDDGGGEGEFFLPKRLNAGEYTVRAYTNFMRNFDESYFFLKKIHIGSTSTLVTNQTSSLKSAPKKKLNLSPLDLKPDLQFFPEGGHMVTSQTSKIGLKALDMYGKGIDISGSIVDNAGNEIVNFNTLKFGLGSLRFTPKKAKSYKALIQYNGKNYTYDLPDALSKGLTMNVIERKNSYQVYIHSSLPEGVDQLTLTGLQNGKIVNVAQLIGSKKRGVINVPKSTLKQGIVQFTILDRTEKPLCERLVFVKTELPEPKVNIHADKKEFTKRELVELDFEIDSITQANMSLAVTDMAVVEPYVYGLDIRSHLLLNSELKGEIEHPGYYFDPKNKDRKEMLDLLMITQGWRQFLWNHEDQNIKEYTHETGIRFKGIIKKEYSNTKVKPVEMSLTYSNGDDLVHDETKTFDSGKFIFGDYHFKDSTSIIIQAKKYKIDKKTKLKKNKKPNMNYFIALDSFVAPPLAIKQKYLDNQYNLDRDYLETTNKPISRDYLTRPKMILLDSINPFEGDFEELEEVIVKQTWNRKEIKEKFKNRQTIYGEPTYRVDMDEIYTFGTTSVLASLQGKVPGLRISTDGYFVYSIRIRGASFSLTGEGHSPLILLNNMPTSLDVISSIIAADVSFVDVLSPTRAAIYGSRALGGVINVHTKRGNEGVTKDKKGRSGIINFTHPGYYKARKFYEPNYKVEKPEHKNFDYRSTIYWNPTLKLNEKGKAKISFYAADIPSTYRIEIQGITTKGSPIVNEVYVDVK